MIEFGFDFGVVGVSSEDAHGVRGRCTIRGRFEKRLHYRLALGTSAPDYQNKLVDGNLHGGCSFPEGMEGGCGKQPQPLIGNLMLG